VRRSSFCVWFAPAASQESDWKAASGRLGDRPRSHRCSGRRLYPQGRAHSRRCLWSHGQPRYWRCEVRHFADRRDSSPRGLRVERGADWRGGLAAGLHAVCGKQMYRGSVPLQGFSSWEWARQPALASARSSTRCVLERPLCITHQAIDRSRCLPNRGAAGVWPSWLCDIREVACQVGRARHGFEAV